jgi:tetratricopeptide (TPR) repeat protein
MDVDEIRGRNTFLADVEARFSSGDDEAILELARDRLQRTPGDLDARIAICRVWVRQGRLDEAKELLQELEEPLAGLSPIYVSLGQLCLEKGRQEEARTYYRKFMALNPDSPKTADISRRLREIEVLYKTEADGEATAGGAEEESPDVPDDFQTVTLAELYIRQGHLEQAIEVLEAILRKDPRQEKAAEKLREVREIIGRKADAGDNAPIIAELSRWLDHVCRLRTHAE